MSDNITCTVAVLMHVATSKYIAEVPAASFYQVSGNGLHCACFGFPAVSLIMH